MTNQELIRKLQSRIKRVANAISDELSTDIPAEVVERQKVDKKLLAALYEAEGIKKMKLETMKQMVDDIIDSNARLILAKLEG